MNGESFYQQRLEEMKLAAREEALAAQGAEAIEAPPSERVSFLDPDFVLMVMFAIFVDGLDFIKEPLIVAFGISKAIGVIFDVATFFIISWWICYRTGKMIKSKQGQIKALQQKAAKVGGKMEKQLARQVAKKGAKSAVKKALLRGGIALLGELAPLIGMIPFWTIAVIMTLREKG